MTPNLADLAGCFEGVIPSIVATVSADGTPNISYLSHVVMVDEEHIALSNQFFTKTASNLRANPLATLLLVDGRDGAQFRVGVRFVGASEDGPLFERVAAQLAASSAQVGMAGVMRLRSVDLFRVEDIVAYPSPSRSASSSSAYEPDLERVAAVVDAISGQSELTAVVDATLTAIETHFRIHSAMILLGPIGGVLTTVGSLGYERSGIGSEVTLGDGVIGMAAARCQTVKVSDMSRVRRYGAAVRALSTDEDRSRSIAVPSLPDAMSQIAVPMLVQGGVQGVLFAESRERMAFGARAETGLSIVARQAALAVTLAEALSREAAPAGQATVVAAPAATAFRVDHHAFDDSVFIDGSYVIKGVAGRLLVHMLDAYVSDGRTDFTNREIRLSRDLKLPEFKDNLETRLLLLQRRLDERSLPVRLLRQGRGQIRLVLDGAPVLRKLT
ncbi:pyridoxamine 5'-phosphate oxidase family protein [Consotaella salsifontis]|uniref:GAF domain-containing protein n=1 Tax=Consotaella salsifontis TaxID=1365950 RepID=A0A1T4PU28_9HYPH|nr:pyridoxamine 5'-phosphate oxidase family protein [Consotaella salsifontis]SJZ94781.1 GAF domain-containing protein [Consotaella salsifontis]